MTARADTAAPILRAGGVTAALLLALGLAAFAALFWGFRVEPGRAFHAYLTAYAYVSSIVLGCMAFVMISHAANATWPVAVRRLPEAVAGVMPLLALLFVPIWLGLTALYPWTRPDAFTAHVRELLEHRQPYMNTRAFTLRAACYLTIWSALALRLRQLSMAMERGVDPARCSRRLRRLSYAGLPVLSVTVALSAFEWLMSLSPEFASTMFGALWIGVCLFGGLAATVFLTGLAQRSVSPLLAPNSAHYSALGRLLLAFLIFLAYTEIFQLILAWMANRPSEAEWFLERGRHAYAGSVWFLVFGHLGLPLALLLSYRLKRRIEPLFWIALWCLLCHYIHIHWLVTPAAHARAWSVWDPLAWLAVSAMSASFGLWFQRGNSLAAVADPRYSSTFSYQSR